MCGCSQEWNNQLPSSSPPLFLLALPTKNLNQQSIVGSTTMDSVFPHWEGTFSLPCPFVLPDSPIYWPQKLSEGLWRDINEKKCTESPAGTWTQEKKRVWALSGGVSPLFNSYIWAVFHAACRILTQMIKSNVTLTPLFYLWTHRGATSTGHDASYTGSYTAPSLITFLLK